MRRWLWLWMTMACSGGQPEPAPDTEEQAREAEAFNSKMQQHFELATDARTAVIKGDLDSMKLKMAQLAAIDAPEVPEPWKPHIATMKTAATEASKAEDLSAAADAVTRVAQVCGDCHLETGGGPKAAAAEALKTVEPPEAHMKRHLWCADRMWLGLVAPSADLYKSTAKVLAESHLHPRVEHEHEDEEGHEQFVTLETQIHELAEAASTADTAKERGKLFGAFLANCASCHTSVGVDPEIE